MRVLLVANYLYDEQQSMQRFAALMEQGLMQAGHEVRVCRPPAIIGRIHPSGRGVGKWLGYVDKFGVFPMTLRSATRWSDLVHICDHSNSFYVKHLRSRPHLVTCHDVLAIRSALGEIPQHRTGGSGRHLQRIIVKGLKQAQHVVCVSEATRSDLLRVVPMSETRVSRTYNSLNYPYTRMPMEEAGARLRKMGIASDQAFLLHVGGNQWYKNRLGVLRIFASLRRRTVNQSLKLVMAGKPWTGEMCAFIAESGLGNDTVELNSLDNEDLRALYSTAKVLLFPSLQEGFGWPILEAQSCGCPVVTSSRSPMNEVGGTAAIYIDPDNPESAAAEVASTIERADGLRAYSLQNAARFDMSTMIRGYLTVYQKVCDDYTARHQLG